VDEAENIKTDTLKSLKKEHPTIFTIDDNTLNLF
jgi:hypothetical protein